MVDTLHVPLSVCTNYTSSHLPPPSRSGTPSGAPTASSEPLASVPRASGMPLVRSVPLARVSFDTTALGVNLRGVIEGDHGEQGDHGKRADQASRPAPATALSICDLPDRTR